MRKITLELCYNTEYYDVPDVIEAEISEDLEQAISEYQNEIDNNETTGNGLLKKVGLNDKGLLLEWNDDAHGRIGHSAILVYSHGWYWEVQNKYDSSLQAEYQERVADSV